MTNKVITCFFCFEQFEVSLEISTSFTGNNIEIYDCEICCNPNKLDYVVYDGEININNVSDGNEWIIPHHYSTVQVIEPSNRILIEEEICTRLDGCPTIKNVCADWKLILGW